jgi:hypothetical protein
MQHNCQTLVLLSAHFHAASLITGSAASSYASANGTEVERARTAHDALSAMLAPPQVGPLVEALVAKYVALSSEELEEWQSDPEGYIRCAACGNLLDQRCWRSCMPVAIC